jgi:membrane protein insertase Oxa1/YidC/SpoIIIJ
MNEVVKSLIEFLGLFIIIFIVYKLIYRKKKDFSKLKDSDEVRIFVLRYNLDIRKIDYNKLLTVLALINAFIIAFTATIIVRIDSIAWTIIVCLLIVLALIFSLFNIAGRYFKSHEKEIVVEEKIEEVIKETRKKKTKKKEGKK